MISTRVLRAPSFLLFLFPRSFSVDFALRRRMQHFIQSLHHYLVMDVVEVRCLGGNLVLQFALNQIHHNTTKKGVLPQINWQKSKHI
jgi:hypothetical protein